MSSRKGILDARITVHGRAAHAGVEPEKGRSAILEAADLVHRAACAERPLAGRDRQRRGHPTAAPGPNVVAERCSLEVDVRAVRRADLEAAEAEIRSMLASLGVPDTTAELEDMARWWPMEKLERSGRLVDHAVALAARLGFEVRDAATGGASDANTTAGLGVATIDGLGPIGGIDHSPAEYLEVASIVPRTTLLAALIARDRSRPGRPELARAAATAADRRRISSGSPYEARYGYSRAVVVGDACFVCRDDGRGCRRRVRPPR